MRELQYLEKVIQLLCKSLIMQVVSGKIKNGIETIISSSLFLSQNSVMENFMTTRNLPKKEKTIKICSISDCTEKILAHGWCQKHHGRWRRYGDPLFVKNKHGVGHSREEQFWSRVKKNANEKGCWEWQGGTNKKGYGQVHFKAKQWRTHRLAWFLITGKDSELFILHYCDNRICVRPDHLFEGTNDDNMKDMVAKGRAAHGDVHCNAKLTVEKVKEIKRLFITTNFTNSKIARIYKVGYNAIRKIRIGETWQHVND